MSTTLSASRLASCHSFLQPQTLSSYLFFGFIWETYSNLIILSFLGGSCLGGQRKGTLSASNPLTYLAVNSLSPAPNILILIQYKCMVLKRSCIEMFLCWNVLRDNVLGESWDIMWLSYLMYIASFFSIISYGIKSLKFFFSFLF